MKNILPKVVLKHRKDAPLRRSHRWVFSGAIHRIEGEVQDGDIVEVYSGNGDYLASGHYNNGSIAVRVFSFVQTEFNQAFWEKRLQEAYAVREMLGLTNHPETNAYRLVHAEGDGLPGLILDYYNGVIVLQAHSLGMYKAADDIVGALKTVYGDKLRGIYNKSAETLPADHAKTMSNGYLFGESGEPIITEYGHQFFVDWEGGQKTGFFLDQRENRKLLAQYVSGKTVLNAFCYSGGFSVYALTAGAKSVHSVDSSQKAMDLTEQNMSLLKPKANQHQSLTADVMKFLKERPEDYEVMVLDPPAFAKNIRSRHNAVQGYKRLNALGLRSIKKGGILFTFSCSQVIDRKLFRDTIMAAALEAGRPVRILHELSQPADHPVNLFHPEVSYLKGLVLYVD